MLVYGDRETRVETAPFLEDLLDRARRPPGRPGAIGAREHAMRLLVDTGRFVQGLVDDAFSARGRRDDWTDLERACADLLLAAGRTALGREAAWHRPNVNGRSRFLRLREPEGYAYYALYPEQYAAAARRFRETVRGPVVVIGLRSIGTSLAGILAAALDAPPPITLRPTGHVFDRTLALTPALEDHLLAIPGAYYGIADEGPGLSGSSLASVANWLVSKGIPHDRVHFFPGHANGPGPKSPAAIRELWSRIRLHHVPFEDAVLDDLFPRDGRIDLSGGLWKRLRGDLADAPADPARERRKYLVTLDGVPTLARFAGLGAVGERKAERARLLADSGFTPAFRGLRHGFLLECWHAATTATVPPAHLGRYLAFRAARFPCGRDDGASVADLWTMVRRNVNADSHSTRAEVLAAWEPALAAIEEARRPVAVDGRLHAWEWIRLENGAILKTDAHDHAEAHDCVGAQDIAWDAAGAVVECECPFTFFDDLAPTPRPPRWAEFHLLAYAAFQLGLWTYAGHAAQVARYERVVDDLLAPRAGDRRRC